MKCAGRPWSRGKAWPARLPGVPLVALALALASPQGPTRGGLAAQEPPLTLGEVLEGALLRHPSLGALRAARQGAEAGRREARGSLLPALDARAAATRFELPMVVAPIHALDASGPRPDFDETLLQSRLQGTWTLFDGGVRSGRIRGAEAGAEGAAAAVDDGVGRILERGIAGYLAVRTSRAVAAANRERLSALEAERDRAARFLQEGRAPRVELLRADAALQQARADAASAEAAVGLAEAELARLAGLEPSAVVRRPLEPLATTAASLRDAEGTPDEPTPALRQARERVVAAGAAVSAARALYLPRVAAAGGVNQYGGARGNLSTEWDVGVQLQWSLFSGGSRQAVVERARADLRRAEEELRGAELQRDSERDAATAALAEALGRREALEAAVEGFEEVVRIEELALSEGVGIQRDLLSARASLLDARAGLARAEQAVVMARTALARARGVLTLPWIMERWQAGVEGEPEPDEEGGR
jgi:outer membrane protein TolC